jgi:sporulation protein YlmC with PRC-barrel domain
MPEQHAIEDLRAGADVYSSDGQKVGTLYAVVINPRDNHVSHLAVDAGPHFPEPGFGNPKIISVDIGQLRKADGESVDLALTEADFRKLPLYEHEHFFALPQDEQPPEDKTPRRLWDVGLTVATALAGLGTGLAVPAEHFARAPFERHILDDAPVWRDEPNQHIGDVERVLVDDKTNVMVGLVIRRGVLFHHEVVLPMQYVTEVRDGAIIAHLSDEDLERLTPFTG